MAYFCGPRPLAANTFGPRQKTRAHHCFNETENIQLEQVLKKWV